MKHAGKKLAFVLFAAACALPATGCGVGTTQSENNRTIRRVVDYDQRMMVDDLMLWTQTTRPWRGSRYPIK